MELRYCEQCGDLIPLAVGNEKLTPTESFICLRCREGAAAGRPAAPRENAAPAPQQKASGDDCFRSFLEQSSMNLFSPATVALKRKEHVEKEARQELNVLDKQRPQDVAGSGTPIGSSTPARTARKLQFRCLHCRAILMVRPVGTLSRIICPKCRSSLFIDKTGIVSRRPAPGEGRGRPAPAREERARADDAALREDTEEVRLPPDDRDEEAGLAAAPRSTGSARVVARHSEHESYGDGSEAATAVDLEEQAEMPSSDEQVEDDSPPPPAPRARQQAAHGDWESGEYVTVTDLEELEEFADAVTPARRGARNAPREAAAAPYRFEGVPGPYLGRALLLAILVSGPLFLAAFAPRFLPTKEEGGGPVWFDKLGAAVERGAEALRRAIQEHDASDPVPQVQPGP